MKKILLTVCTIAFLLFGFNNQARSQCSGAEATITNFVAFPNANSVFYGFDWAFVHGNASIEVAFLCNGVEVGTLNCIPRIKDSTAGAHHVTGTFPITCNGVIRVEIRIWTNPNCGGNNCTIFRDISQSTLPVDFKSFTATRNKSNVMLKWVTSTEKNNDGFAIERSTDGSNWVEAAYVPTQGLGGNSNQDLTYQYIDLNNTKGITQYRIRQVDIDSRSKFSEVRSVKGEGQIGKVIVYPNPTTNGRVNVVFDDAAVVRDITVMDMSGRTVKSIRGIANNNVTIENLHPGMYTLRVFVPETGEQAVEKIVVNQR